MGEIDPQRVNYKRKQLHYPNYGMTKPNMPTNKTKGFLIQTRSQPEYANKLNQTTPNGPLKAIA